MDFFNNQGNNSKDNEILLDAIMKEQSQRENKPKKAYLLNRKVGKVSNPFDDDISKEEADEIKNGGRDFEHKPITNDAGVPVFVVGNRFTQRKTLTKKAKTTIFVAAMLTIVLIVATFFAVFFLSKHKIDVVCGNIDGITILNEDSNAIDTINLRMYEKFTFKVTIKETYSNSKIEVLYNDTKLIPDKNGYYTIQYLGGEAELRITGVVQNNYNVVFDDNANFQYVLVGNTGAKEYLDGKTKTNFYGNKIKFMLANVQEFWGLPQAIACVYDNGVLLTPDENGVYELEYNKHHNLESFYHSPYEYFTYNVEYDTQNTSKVKSCTVTGLSALGKAEKIVSFPNTFEGVLVEYNFNKNDYTNTTEQIIISNDMYLDEKTFDLFPSLQKIEVNVVVNTNVGYYSENGILYFNQHASIIDGSERSVTLTKVLVKVPTSYGKNLAIGERILTVNPDVIASGAINRLMYIKTLQIGNKTTSILPLALKGDDIPEEYSYTVIFNGNQNFVVENNVIYNKAKTAIISAQFVSGKFTVPSGMVIADKAFAFSKITELTFAGTAILSEGSLDNMGALTKVVMPSNTGSLPLGRFAYCSNLAVIDLSNIATVITINDFAVDLSWETVQIVVADDKLSAYQTTFADTPMANSFVSVTEYNS